MHPPLPQGHRTASRRCWERQLSVRFESLANICYGLAWHIVAISYLNNSIRFGLRCHFGALASWTTLAHFASSRIDLHGGAIAQEVILPISGDVPSVSFFDALFVARRSQAS